MASAFFGNFDVNVAFDDCDDRARPRHDRPRLSKDVVIVPSQAVFSFAGEDVVYVMGHGAPERLVDSD